MRRTFELMHEIGKEMFKKYPYTEYGNELRIDDEVAALFGYVSTIKDLTNEMVEYLNVFIETFDAKLYKTTKDILDEWVSSGMFDNIINEAFMKELNELGVTMTEELNGKRSVDVPITKNDLDSELLEIMSGTTTGTINILSEPRDKSVTPYKTTFIETNKNKLNQNKLTTNVLLGDNGELLSTTGYKTSEFIPVEVGSITSTPCRKLALYNQDKIFISPLFDVTPMVQTTVPVSQKGYVRVSYRDDYADEAMVVYGQTLPNEFVAFQNTLESNIKVTPQNFSEKIGVDDVSFLGLKNLFDKNKVTRDSILDVNNGSVVQSVATIGVYGASNFIPVFKGQYVLTINRNVCVYDKKTNFVKSYNFNTESIQIESDGYIRVSFWLRDIEKSMVQRGDSLNEYIPYGVMGLSSNIKIYEENLGVNVGEGTSVKDTQVGIHFGDSITANKGLIENVAKVSGYTVYNFGVGATRMVDLEVASTGYQKLNFLDLLRAKTSGNWSKIDEGLSEVNDTDLVNRINQLKNIDMTKVNYLAFMYGTNDVNTSGLERGTVDSTDTFTTNGALNEAFRLIYENYPHLRVFAFAPIFRPVMPNTDPPLNSDEYTRNAGYFLYDIGHVVEEKAKEFKTPFKNMYYESGINQSNWRTFIDDGTHPNEKGKELLGRVIGKFVSSN